MISTTLHDVIALVGQLSTDVQRTLLHTLEDRQAALCDAAQGWTLQGAQLAFMLQHHDSIEAAYACGELASLDVLGTSEEYQALFGDMSWDEAYDRFKETCLRGFGSYEGCHTPIGWQFFVPCGGCSRRITRQQFKGTKS